MRPKCMESVGTGTTNRAYIVFGIVIGYVCEYWAHTCYCCPSNQQPRLWHRLDKKMYFTLTDSPTISHTMEPRGASLCQIPIQTIPLSLLLALVLLLLLINTSCPFLIWPHSTIFNHHYHQLMRR